MCVEKLVGGSPPPEFSATNLIIISVLKFLLKLRSSKETTMWVVVWGVDTSVVLVVVIITVTRTTRREREDWVKQQEIFFPSLLPPTEHFRTLPFFLEDSVLYLMRNCATRKYVKKESSQSRDRCRRCSSTSSLFFLSLFHSLLSLALLSPLSPWLFVYNQDC